MAQLSRDPLARAIANAERNFPYPCPDLGQELDPNDPAPEAIYRKARRMEALSDAGWFAAGIALFGAIIVALICCFHPK